MTGDAALSRQSRYFQNKSQLRDLLKRYLEASQEPPNYSWQTLGTSDGLPHLWVYDLFQDSRGRVWAATWGGGAGFWADGKWRLLTRQQGLLSNNVTCIREDRQGQIWLGTDRGLNVFEEDHIREAGLTGKSLLSLVVDQKDRIWAGCWRASRSGGGLFCLEGGSWKSFSKSEGLPGQEILKVFEDTRGRIWVGTYEGGIGAGAGCLEGNKWHSYRKRDGLIDNCVYSMFEDPAGAIWFGTVGGISIFDGKHWHRVTEQDGLADNRVYSMLIDRNKKMWFGTEGGVSRFDGEDWISFTQEDGLAENLVRTILETSDKELWFGTYPYTAGRGGISIARSGEIKSLPDRILDLLPDGGPSGLLGDGKSDQTAG